MPDLPEFSPMRTVVMLMGVGRLSTLRGDLGAVGYPDDVPVAVIERAGLESQRVTSAELGAIAGVAAARGVAAPAIIVIGRAVDTMGRPGQEQVLGSSESEHTRPATGSSKCSSADELAKAAAEAAVLDGGACAYIARPEDAQKALPVQATSGLVFHAGQEESKMEEQTEA